MFKRFARDKLGADTIATGHYAQVQRDDGGGHVRLLRARDVKKDQSYFLSMTSGAALADVIFPVGGMLKDEVKQLATGSPLLRGLPILTKPESMGVCFIGKRSMPDFLSNYFQLTPGR
jgi:tRNA-specific 2-thiouridylase